MTQNEKSKIRAKVIKWVTRLFLILVAIIMLYPLAWNVVSSFKTSTEFLTDPFAWPQGLAWDNYVRAYEKSNLAANIGNSIYCQRGGRASSCRWPAGNAQRGNIPVHLQP